MLLALFTLSLYGTVAILSLTSGLVGFLAKLLSSSLTMLGFCLL